MNRRAWQWAISCGLLGALLLAASIDSAVSFHAPRSNPEQVVTFHQVAGFVFGGLLLIVSGLILLTGWRRRRERLREQEFNRQSRF